MQRLVRWIGGLVSLPAAAGMLVLSQTQPNQADNFFNIASLLIAVFGVLVAVLGVWVAMMTYRVTVRQRDTSHDLALTAIADQLAVAVDSLWNKEAELRRLNDPHPLPVSWEAADSDLVEDWSLLAKTARNWPGKLPLDPSDWATQPSGLCGSNGELGDILSRRVPTGRLVVLGEPGAGKSILLVRLVLDLLARRDKGGPVPVLVPLASWNPDEQDLHTWLESKLITDHPGLREPAPAAVGKMNRVRALLDRRLLLPILDGLDEMPDTVRGLAIAKINEALRPREGLVLSSRVAEYSQAVQPKGKPHVKLRSAAGVTLRELDPTAIETYLRRDAGSATSAARWDPVVKVLHTTAPAAPGRCAKSYAQFSDGVRGVGGVGSGRALRRVGCCWVG